MGRNPKPADELRNIRVGFRVDTPQYAAITAAAEKMAMDIPEFIRWSALAKAKEVRK